MLLGSMLKRKCDNHHWTLNPLEDGERQTLSKEEDDKIQGLINWCSDELSIRREIIYELCKVIPLEDTIRVLGNVYSKWEKEKYERKRDKRREQVCDRYRKNRE